MSSVAASPAAALPTRRFSLNRLLRLGDGTARSLVLKQFALMDQGHLVIEECGEEKHFGQKDSPLHARLIVRHPQTWSDMVLGGSVGAGEAWMRGDWDSPDLAALIALLSRNWQVIEGLDGGLRQLARPLLRGLHWLDRNTREGSRRNISAHYDLGNDFFALFLDPSMMYSSAIFPKPESTLEEAQFHKLETLCLKLDLRPTDHLLEIGSGWGAMAIHAASRFGCRVTTTTISQEQFNLASERVAVAGLADKVKVLLKDYRDLEGSYDKLVSVEMIEAVGHEFLPAYFHHCSRLLKPDGLFVLQAITIPDQRYDEARKDVDFIKRYIFPGCTIPSVARMLDCVKTRSDLRLTGFDEYAEHYADTLKEWHRRLMQHASDIERRFNPEFLRMWRYYLAYCEGAFRERRIGCAHLVLAKPGSR
ncbi:MAG: hypothetical protein RL095_3047 [Verrucomicrobiota bacterium]|jgi:cyclopropane-fatty-acyl-phospholipid synthase